MYLDIDARIDRGSYHQFRVRHDQESEWSKARLPRSSDIHFASRGWIRLCNTPRMGTKPGLETVQTEPIPTHYTVSVVSGGPSRLHAAIVLAREE